MEFDIIQQFFSPPQLPDVIAYAVLLIVFVVQLFIKKFVQKDNFITMNFIGTKVADVEKLKKTLDEIIRKSNEAYSKWEEEKENLKKEQLERLEVLTQVLRVCVVNNKELIEKGVSNELVKLLKSKENIEKIVCNMEEDVDDR